MPVAQDELEIFSTCPQSRGADRVAYANRVADAARWSEQAGHRGMLVYSDNGIVDPWLVAQSIVNATTTLCPLVAVQPVYMHPYAVAKMVTTIAYLHGRRVYLNLLAGGFKTDLLALADETPHDDRYDRTTEYGTIVARLLEGGGPVTLEGRYYTVRSLTLAPALDVELMPGVLLSGSSPAGVAAAVALGATAVRYPRPVGDEQDAAVPTGTSLGARFGVIARASAEEAWQVANERFPDDRRGRVAHRLAMKVSDSHWHHQLSELGAATTGEADVYWLGPFERHQTFCPYLVGSHEAVAAEIGRYLDLGFRTFVLDIVPSEEEFAHTSLVFERACAALQA